MPFTNKDDEIKRLQGLIKMAFDEGLRIGIGQYDDPNPAWLRRHSEEQWESCGTKRELEEGNKIWLE